MNAKIAKINSKRKFVGLQYLIFGTCHDVDIKQLDQLLSNYLFAPINTIILINIIMNE